MVVCARTLSLQNYKDELFTCSQMIFAHYLRNRDNVESRFDFGRAPDLGGRHKIKEMLTAFTSSSSQFTLTLCYRLSLRNTTALA